MTTALVFPTSALLLGAVLTAASIARAESPAESAKIVAALDTEYQAAVKNNDAATMDRILADDFVLVTGRGQTFTKADLLKDAREKSTVYEHQEELEQKVRVWGDTAVVTALLWIKGDSEGKTSTASYGSAIRTSGRPRAGNTCSDKRRSPCPRIRSSRARTPGDHALHAAARDRAEAPAAAAVRLGRARLGQRGRPAGRTDPIRQSLRRGLAGAGLARRPGASSRSRAARPSGSSRGGRSLGPRGDRGGPGRHGLDPGGGRSP